MKRTVLNVQQGTPEWNAARAASDGTASEYPAAAGKSKHQQRTALLDQRKHGISKEIDSVTQALFDKGHAAEASARPIAEELISDELSPTTITLEIDGLTLLASLDGITFDDEIIFEHKLWNANLAEQIANGFIDDHYTLQMDQQLLVSGAKRCLFMCSDGTKENCAWTWYDTTEEKKAAVVATWQQFHADLDNHAPKESVEAPKTEAVESFPVPSIQVRGELVACNLEAITPYFDKFLTETKTKLETDEDFAQGEVNAKASREAAKNCKLTAKAVIDQIMPVSEVVRTLEGYADKFDKLGLALEKAVKDQKDAIKSKAISDAGHAFLNHVNALYSETKPIEINVARPDFAGAIKGLKTLTSMHNAISTALANGKIEADAVAKDIRAKLAWCKENAAGMSMLFPDLQQIISKPMDDFTLLITSRIDAHKKAEAERIEEETLRIRQEEQAKVEAEAKEKARIAEMVAAASKLPDMPESVVKETMQRIGVEQDAPSPAPAANEVVVDMKQSVVDHHDEISSFMASREFGKESNKVRAILVEFVKWQATHGLKQAA